MKIHGNIIVFVDFMDRLLLMEYSFWSNHWFNVCTDANKNKHVEEYKIGDLLLQYENCTYKLAIIESVDFDLSTESHILYDELSIKVIGEKEMKYESDYNKVVRLLLRESKLNKFL